MEPFLFIPLITVNKVYEVVNSIAYSITLRKPSFPNQCSLSNPHQTHEMSLLYRLKYYMNLSFYWQIITTLKKNIYSDSYELPTPPSSTPSPPSMHTTHSPKTQTTKIHPLFWAILLFVLHWWE